MTDEHAPGLTARPSATGKSRIVALDGLRAVALLIIMGYHFGVGWLQGGFFSLDIFYVLSGYLITGLLLGEWARAARIRLGAFWLRRARRLLPALLVVLVVVTLVVLTNGKSSAVWHGTMVRTGLGPTGVVVKDGI